MAGGRHVFVSGRWDSSIAVVDLDAALQPGKNADAIVSRPRVTPDIDGEPAAGLPVAIVQAPKFGRLAVINHAGNASRSDVSIMPHGHAGSVAVLDLARAVDPACSGTTDALIATIPVAPGPVGAVLLPDGRHVLVSSSEGSGTEDGGCTLSLVDIAACTHVADFELGHSGAPSRSPSPDAAFGSYPNPCGIAFTPAHGGLILVANGGSADVSVIPLANITGRRRIPETGRIAVASGAFGIDINAEGSLAAVCNREDPRTGKNGSSITLIDTRAALDNPRAAALADIPVGGEGSRPTGISFSRCGSRIYTSCTYSGTVSMIDAGARREIAVRPLDEDGEAMPRGVATTADGEHVLVAGGKRGTSGSSSLWVLDAETLTPKVRIRGVGNESYFLSGG